MREKESSENHIMNCLKVIIDYANHLKEINFTDINKKENIVSSLNLKIKPESLDPDKRWITTWNHYLNRLKLFLGGCITVIFGVLFLVIPKIQMKNGLLQTLSRSSKDKPNEQAPTLKMKYGNAMNS
jgi:hypothetical protein